jgi:hypothetical protein
MADDKEKSSGGESLKEAGERLVVIILFLIILSVILYRITGSGDLSFWTEGMQERWDAFIHENAFGKFIASLIFGIQFLGTYISILFFLGIVYLVIRMHKLHHEEHHMYAPPHETHESPEKMDEKKWARIEAHLASDNPSDWRLAILEADILLEEKMEGAGLIGATLGDKLKNTDKNNFPPLDNAWEAHKIRNLIAHEGSNFLISQREAKRVVGLYKDVLSTLTHSPHRS